MRSFIVVLLIWSFPWVIFAISFGLFSSWFQIFAVAGVSMFFYAAVSQLVCLWSLGTYRPLYSPVTQKVKKKIKLVEVQSPSRAVYLFKGLPGQAGIVAITTAELSLVTEAKLLTMVHRAEKTLMKSDVYLWTWVFPAYQLLTQSQEMLTGLVTAKKLVQGLFWYAPFRLFRSVAQKHSQEFPSIDSMI